MREKRGLGNGENNKIIFPLVKEGPLPLQKILFTILFNKDQDRPSTVADPVGIEGAA
jgi:hypothetical protein